MGLCNVNIALLVLLCIILFREVRSVEGFKAKFASARANMLATMGGELFSTHGDKTTFMQFKKAIKGTDAVEYNDVRQLWRANKLTADNIDAVS